MSVAQALRKSPIRLLRQPDWIHREYDFDQDPLWHTEVKAQPFDAILWYQCDHLGTPMELTDHNGEVAWAAQYKAWGEIKETRSDWAKQVGLTNPIRFQGQYHDQETGLHYNRNRYYEPSTGRFVSQDPIGLSGGVNLYQYAPNPQNWTDPFGLSGKSLPNTTNVNRIGGSQVENLRLKNPEEKLDPPGISVLHSCCPCESAQQMREAFPTATGLHKTSETVASGTAHAIREAGFDVIEDPTKNFKNHARIIHPDGVDGFNDENLKGLSKALGETTRCPR